MKTGTNSSAPISIFDSMSLANRCAGCRCFCLCTERASFRSRFWRRWDERATPSLQMRMTEAKKLAPQPRDRPMRTRTRRTIIRVSHHPNLTVGGGDSPYVRPGCVKRPTLLGIDCVTAEPIIGYIGEMLLLYNDRLSVIAD